MKKINAPFKKEDIAGLRAGERVFLSGIIYTMRDAAHKRLTKAMENGEKPPFPLEGAVIYYAGPTPAPPGKVIGSAGPTTSCRMDAYAPALLNEGVLGMVGKGDRSQSVVDSMVENGAVYLAAVGGAAALIGSCVLSAEIIAFEDLGAEAIRKLTVQDMPLIVAIDCGGENYYAAGQRKYHEYLGQQGILYE